MLPKSRLRVAERPAGVWFFQQVANRGSPEGFFHVLDAVIHSTVERAKSLAMRLESQRAEIDSLDRIHCVDDVEDC